MLQDQPGTLTALSAGDADGQDGVKLSFFEGLSIGRVASGLSLAQELAAALCSTDRPSRLSEALKALVFFAGGHLNDLPAITQQELIDAVRAVDGLPTLRRISQELS